MKHKGRWLLAGYTLFTLGITAVALQVVGSHWVMLGFLEWGGRLLSFIFKILMIMAGAIIIVLANTDWEREKRESGE